MPTPAPPPVLSIRDAEKTYAPGSGGAVDALRGVSLDIAPGEFVTLMGPSGCGKSTLLHLAGAMDRPTAGSIVLDGTDITHLSEEQLATTRRDKLGFVFQFFNLLPTLDLVENVALPALLQGTPRNAATAKSEQLLERVGLAPRRHHFISQLSGGEMQRAAVARALVTGPKLVLADEPTGSLDSTNGSAVLDLLASLNRDEGLTLLVATHSQTVAGFSSRTIHLKDGGLEN